MSTGDNWLRNERELHIFVHESARPFIQCCDSKRIDHFSLKVEAFVHTTVCIKYLYTSTLYVI